MTPKNTIRYIKKLCLVVFSNIVHLMAPTLPRIATTQTMVERSLGVGIVSVYGTKSDGFLGKITASGERLSSTLLTVAHRTLPFGTILKIIKTAHGRIVFARVTDRGPFIKNRVLDLNKPTADALGIKGLAKIEYRTIEYN